MPFVCFVDGVTVAAVSSSFCSPVIADVVLLLAVRAKLPTNATIESRSFDFGWVVGSTSSEEQEGHFRSFDKTGGEVEDAEEEEADAVPFNCSIKCARRQARWWRHLQTRRITAAG